MFIRLSDCILDNKMSEPIKQKDEATIQVPAKGKGVPGEGKEPQLPPGPNPELADDRKMVEMVRHLSTV